MSFSTFTVKEAVHKAELAARKAAQESEKSGNNAELRVAAIKAKLAAQHAVKEHFQRNQKLHQKLKSLRRWAHLSKSLIICTHINIEAIIKTESDRRAQTSHDSCL